MSFGKTQALPHQLLGVEISRGTIALIGERLSAALERTFETALEMARQQPVATVAETGAPIGNAVVNVFRAAAVRNPDRKRGWRWVMVTPGVTTMRPRGHGVRR